MSVVIATDLDRTMIFSAASGGETDAPTVCVEHYQGAPLSFMTVRATRLLTALAASTTVVPTTTRTQAQFERIRLPGGPFRFAVVSNGGRILIDGTSDPAWRTALERRVAAESASLAELRADLESRIDESWVAKVREADDLFAYLVVDPERQPADFVAGWQAWCAPRGWSVSQQGRKIYAMPTGVTKSAAIARVREQLVTERALDPEAQLVAAGDGRLDVDLLEYADHAIRPAHGELHESGWSTPGLTVTDSVGIAAGEEILDRFTAHAKSSSVIHSDSALAEN